jgi:ankyrin repeat protein
MLEFAHVSVRDYLQVRAEYNHAKCHSQAAGTCLKYLSSRDRAFLEKLHEDEFLLYSFEFWGQHCRHSGRNNRNSLGISTELLSWLIKGSGLTTFRDWLQRVESFQDSSRPLKDCLSDSHSPIFATCVWDLTEVLENLLPADNVEDKGVDIRNRDGRTSLSLAVRYGYETAAKLLLETGQAEVNVKDRDDCTPLSCAARHGHKVVVKMLLETRQVEVDAKDQSGWKSLSWAAWGGHKPVMKLLLETGQADVDAKDNYGWTPLFCASRCGHEAAVKLLLETGHVEVNARDKDGRTPLYWAAWDGHKAVVKLLLETGQAEVDAKDKYGWTPLFCADRRGHEDVKLLLETGQAEIGAEGSIGWTTLL